MSKSPKRQVLFIHDLEEEKVKLVKQYHYYNLILNKESVKLIKIKVII